MTEYLKKINSLQLEISSNCNLKCTGCARIDPNNYDQVSTLVKRNVFLEVSVIKSLLESSYLQELEYIDFCGSIDDPLMHPEFLEIIDFITKKDIKIIVQTNASLRNPEYWEKIANILKNKKSSYVKFSIDGLEDTNHLYRRGAVWKKIIENAKSYIAAGGRAQWQYIVFPWNEHQVEEAREYSKELGFESFRYRHDRGSVPATEDDKSKKIEKYNKNMSGSWKDFVGRYENHLQDEQILCYAREEQQFFITHEGLVWPCCFLHNGKYRNLEQWKEYTDRFDLHYEKNWNNLYYYNFDEIITHDFYKNDLVKSWDSKTHGVGKCDRLIRCTQTCSKNLLNIGKHKVLSNNESVKRN